MSVATPTAMTTMTLIAPLVIGLAFVAVASLLTNPVRQKFSAVFVAGAGAAYFGGGFGPWELVFCAIITALSYRGLEDYRAIGLAWILHSCWDFAHDLYGNPIIPFAPQSSFGCFVCDPVIAIWYLLGAPNMWNALHERNVKTVP